MHLQQIFDTAPYGRENTVITILNRFLKFQSTSWSVGRKQIRIPTVCSALMSLLLSCKYGTVNPRLSRGIRSKNNPR